ncbi:MAG: peptidylprolyl isomerase [Pirellulaceae bacterium]|nr:peptidylprolyl isomerase [Pirellulaceae bacterium]
MIFNPVWLLTITAAFLVGNEAVSQNYSETSDPYFQAEPSPPRAAVGSPAMRTGTASSNPAIIQTQFSTPTNATQEDSGSTETSSGGSFLGSTEETPSAVRKIATKLPQNEADSTPAAKASRESFEPTRVLARVGDQPIFVSDLSIEAMQLIDKFMPAAPPAVKQQEAKKLIPRLLPKYIQSKLLLVDAIDGLPEGANVEDIFESAGSQFDETMVPKLMKNMKVASPAQLDAYYRNLGSSLRSVRKSWIENELVMYTMREKIQQKQEVSHREMYEVYLANKEQYSTPARVRWEQLLVRFDKYPTKAAAKTAITEMYDSVYHGAKLSAVAEKKSQGFKAKQGGQQGWTTRGSLIDKNLDKLLFTIELDKLSDVVENARGFIVIRALEREEAGFVSFETAQKAIKKKISDEKLELEFQKHIAKVKARVPVEIFEPEVVASNPKNSIR